MKRLGKYVVTWLLLVSAWQMQGGAAMIPACCIFIWGYARGDLGE